jgi:uncharacterized DUF497 family protein
MRSTLVLFLILVAVSILGDPVRCGDGRVDRVIDAFDSVTGWSAPYRDRDLPSVTDRFIAIGPIRRGLVLVVWTERDEEVIRIISARRATKHEQALYRSHIEQTP